MKVSELTDLKQIDQLVAIAQGWEVHVNDSGVYKKELVTSMGGAEYYNYPEYDPTSGNAQTYELIEKFNLTSLQLKDSWRYYSHETFGSHSYVGRGEGSTPAIAICKAVIASKWGDTIPDDVMEQVR